MQSDRITKIPDALVIKIRWGNAKEITWQLTRTLQLRERQNQNRFETVHHFGLPDRNYLFWIVFVTSEWREDVLGKSVRSENNKDENRRPSKYDVSRSQSLLGHQQ